METLTLPRRSGTITEMAWSPDGKKLAAVTDQGWLHVWYTASGSHLFHQRLGRTRLLTVAWARDGRTLAAGSENGVLYRVSRLSNPLITMHSLAAPITQIAWSSSPVGRCLIVSGQTLTVLDERGYPPVSRLYHAAILDTDWSADGRTLAVICDNGLIDVWDTDQQAQCSFTDLIGPQCLAWRSDGQQLAIGTSSGHLHLCDPQVGSISEGVPLVRSSIHALQWGAHGLLVGSGQGELTLMNEALTPDLPPMFTPTFVLHPQGNRLAKVQLGKVALIAL